jgi:parallel beta-helix repeat protein
VSGRSKIIQGGFAVTRKALNRYWWNLSLFALLSFPCGLLLSQGEVVTTTDFPARGISVTLSGPRITREGPTLPRSQATAATESATSETFVVTTVNDTGDGSLRKAITDANANPGLDIIDFDIAGGGMQTISPLFIPLPTIYDPVLIDGATQPGYSGTPLIRLSGTSMNGYNMLNVYTDDCVIRGLDITDVHGGTGIVLSGDTNTVVGNFFGLDPSGTMIAGIEYNGVIIEGSGNHIGGTLPQNRNCFAGTGSPAIALTGTVAKGNIVEGNFVGTDLTGTVNLGTEAESVILINGASDNMIGGTASGARNIFAGSSLASGISIVGAFTDRDSIVGNYIGTDVTGRKAFGHHGNGIFLTGTDSTVIGGLSLNAGNLICGNGGNTYPAIYLDSTSLRTQILGNSIGIGADGLTSIPNFEGIFINGSPDNIVRGNTISGNTFHGVAMRHEGAAGNLLLGNLIGSTPLGAVFGNNGHGIQIGASDNTIGGRNPGDANVIAGNFGAGVSIDSGQGNTISENSIFANYGLGIDLAPGGVNPNDTLDADSGANAMQNYPVLDSLKRHPNSTDVYGHLVSEPGSPFTVEFYADSGDLSHYGQGHDYLGSISTMTDPGGIARFAVTIPTLVSPREVVTATATDPGGNTSEFCRDIGNDYHISKPSRGELWVVGDQDTIRWESSDTGHVKIEFSSDSGSTYRTITSDTIGAAHEFPWTVVKARSAHCRIRVTSIDDPSLTGESELFKVKGIELTRYTSDSSYEAFSPAVHGWSFPNDSATMWAAPWFSRFNYMHAVDPITMQVYPAAWSTAPINAINSDFPDWQLFVSAFGVNKCYFSTPTGMGYRPSSVKFWTSLKGKWGGSCHGFAISSLMAFDDPGTFVINEPNMPFFVDLFPLVADSAHHLQDIVSRLWIYTVGKVNKIQSDNHANDPLSDILDTLRADYLGDRRDDRIISFWDKKTSWAHAMAPYRIERDSSNKNIQYLYVYDSNNPGAADKRVVMNVANDTWTYAPLGWGNYRHFVLSRPVSTNYPTAQFPKASLVAQTMPLAVSGLAGEMNIYQPAGAMVRITNDTGGLVQYSDSVEVDSLPGAIPIVLPTGHPSPPIGCTLPAGKYSIELSRFPDTTARLFVFSDSTIYTWYRNGSGPNQHDIVLCDSGITYTSADTATEVIGLQCLLVTQERERELDISGLSTISHDSTHIRIEPDGSLQLTTHGSAHSYDLALTDVSNQGKFDFMHTQIPIMANSTHRVIPDWSDLSNKKVKILIDEGNKGSFTDSLLVDNQLTGVSEYMGGRSIPAEFALLQNYPNPFNPNTVISCQLPVDGNVKLEVYDVLGRVVATLADGKHPAGRYTFTFDGTGLASGVYFYRLQAGNLTAVRKMLLLK